MKPKELPPVELLREWLHYDPELGQLTWRKNRARKNAGKLATSRASTGYLQVKFENKNYQAHRIAWAIYYGKDPGNFVIDHKNRTRDDNRIDNLRIASTADNCYNVARKDNISGFLGVVWNKRLKKWAATIQVERRRLHIGVYALFEDAVAARLQAEEKYGVFVHRG
jgi:hypothetical protein